MGDNAIVAYRDDQQAYAKGEDLRTTKLPIPITEVASYIRQREER
jgi:hypothetical protein